jgi:hypothetical protein
MSLNDPTVLLLPAVPAQVPALTTALQGRLPGLRLVSGFDRPDDATLAGAALDVQAHEPLPPDDPLWDVPGIAITPHIAAQPDHATVAAQFPDDLQRLQQGQPLRNLVDRARGC